MVLFAQEKSGGKEEGKLKEYLGTLLGKSCSKWENAKKSYPPIRQGVGLLDLYTEKKIRGKTMGKFEESVGGKRGRGEKTVRGEGKKGFKFLTEMQDFIKNSITEGKSRLYLRNLEREEGEGFIMGSGT